MEELNPEKLNFNMRLEVYRLVKNLALFIIAILIIKVFLLDTVYIKTEQMSPSIVKGDRVIITKLLYKNPFRALLQPDYNNPLIFKPVSDNGGLRCLRVGAKPGDVILLSRGKYSLINKPDLSLKYQAPDSSRIIPADYSPRDEMKPFRVPVAGETFLLDTLNLRDFVFISSMIHQERNSGEIKIKPLIRINDSIVNDYFIEDFILYNGKLDSIPEKHLFSHFFWDKFSQFIYSNQNDSVSVSIEFRLFDGEEKITDYKVQKRFYFLFAENYLKGYDSRYFGPVCENRFKGKASFVLWSHDSDKSFFEGLRLTRFFKIIK